MAEQAEYSFGFSYLDEEQEKQKQKFIDEGVAWAKQLSEAIQANYDKFLATQLVLIAKEKGVSVEDLCLRHKDICANIQKIDGDIKFWVEVK